MTIAATWKKAHRTLRSQNFEKGRRIAQIKEDQVAIIAGESSSRLPTAHPPVHVLALFCTQGQVMVYPLLSKRRRHRHTGAQVKVLDTIRLCTPHFADHGRKNDSSKDGGAGIKPKTGETDTRQIEYNCGADIAG